MKTSGSVEFMGFCETAIKTICLAASHRNEQGNEELIHRIKTELFETISQQKFVLNDAVNNMKDILTHQKVDLSDVTRTIVSLNDSNMSHVTSKLDTLPQVLYKVDDLRNKYDVSRSSIDQVNTILQNMSAVRKTNHFKGEEGENGLIDILENKLPLRDGYTVQDAKNTPHSCDILVQRTGYPDIRIESKAHGRDNGRNVNPSEVRKFESDLLGLRDHGIFVSLYTGISGKAPIEIDLLPTNKFAIYLSNNNFDGDIIREFIYLIYKLDKFTSETDGLRISSDTIIKIKNVLLDFKNKIENIKTSLKTTIGTLNEMSFDMIDKILTSAQPVETPVQASVSVANIPCPGCDKMFKSQAAVVSHQRNACKKGSPPGGKEVHGF